MFKAKASTILFGLTFIATILFVILTLGTALEPTARAQTTASPARAMITQPIVESNLMRLSGNTRPEANVTNDRGRVPDNFRMEHMLLQLRRPAAQEQDLDQLIDQLHNPSSPNFHKWLTPSQFGAQFGPAASDIQRITGWLKSQGFTVNTVYPSGMTIDFGGDAGKVFAALHTAIHYIQARGATHFANMSDPQIPAALAPAVVGVVNLNNFTPRPMMQRAKAQYTPSGYICGPPSLGFPFPCDLMTPPDLATIYNFNPVFTGGNTGQNQTIYLIEDTDLYTNKDWTTFRSTFGLSGYTGASLSTVHPAPRSGPSNCSDPRVNGDDIEAILDAEYASAAAPSAAIVMATCSGNSVDPLLTAITNLINAASPPAIISMSYGQCETINGATSNAAYNAIYQQGVTEGTSIFVSSGDEDAGVCDYQASVVTDGIGVNALASTPYNVAVGGTDFSDSFSGTNSTYWNSTNTPAFGSAKSYVPEIPWNNSCASQLIATYWSGNSTTYGSSGFCNSSVGENFLDNVGGSGGPSACATGTPSTPGVVSGTCKGYPKPSWQTGVAGIPNDGVRDLPDVSLFAANGVWGHAYIFCFSDPDNGGSPCKSAPIGWGFAGGTSFASPIMAGIQALVNHKTGESQGNPNVQLYKLAAAEYGAGGSSSCNSSNGNAVGSSCVFYDVTLGDIDADCIGSNNCYLPSGTFGVLSTSNSSYKPAYGTATGWDFATGIGTINVNNLVNGGSISGPALQVTPATNVAVSGTQGGPFSPSSFSYTLGASTGSINYSISGLPSWLTASSTSGTTSSGTPVTFTVNASANSLAANTYNATITFTNATNGQGTQTRSATLTVNPPALQVTPPANIAASGVEGGKFSPSSFSYQLSAATSSVNYSITNVPSWLTASSTSGTVTTKRTAITFKINASANTLTSSAMSSGSRRCV